MIDLSVPQADLTADLSSLSSGRRHPGRIRVGVSSCLLGETVRFNSGHCRNDFVKHGLGEFVDFVPVCPEVELGLGTPRDTIRFVQIENDVRFVMPRSNRDLTDGMSRYCQKRVKELSEEDLCGFILKKGSPSCGLERVKIYKGKDFTNRMRAGMFAAELMKQMPHLPLEEEGRLNDARLRENFISRLFAYARWKELERQGVTRNSLFKFHEQHKYLLMAHNQSGLRRLGHLLGSADKQTSVKKLASKYIDGFTAVMRRTPSLKNHTNALQHMAGYVSDALDKYDREELSQVIMDYRNGLVPLIVPVTLLRHYIRKVDVPYLKDQVYLYSHPHELMLLNQI